MELNELQEMSPEHKWDRDEGEDSDTSLVVCIREDVDGLPWTTPSLTSKSVYRSAGGRHGVILLMRPRCSACDQRIDTGWVYCAKCGRKVGGDTNPDKKERSAVEVVEEQG